MAKSATFTCVVFDTLAGLGEAQLEGLVFAPDALVCSSFVALLQLVVLKTPTE